MTRNAYCSLSTSRYDLLSVVASDFASLAAIGRQRMQNDVTMERKAAAILTCIDEFEGRNNKRASTGLTSV